MLSVIRDAENRCRISLIVSVPRVSDRISPRLQVQAVSPQRPGQRSRPGTTRPASRTARVINTTIVSQFPASLVIGRVFHKTRTNILFRDH